MQFKNITFTEKQVIELLEHLGLCNITNHESEFKFAWYDGGSPTGCCLFKKTFTFVYWSKDIKGDIVELVKSKLDCSYKKAFSVIEDFTNQKFHKVQPKDMTPYEQYIHKLKMKMNDDKYEIYDDRILNDYSNIVSDLLLEDGIGAFSQLYFNVIYDNESERIGFPIRDKDGNFVGILGRYNTKKVPIGVAKYLPILQYKKHLILFGLYENMQFIKEKKSIMIVESEKSVLRAFSLGYRNVVALGTCHIHKYQRNLIESLQLEEVVLLLDEGLSNNHYRETAKKLLPTIGFSDYKVKYLNANKCNLDAKECLFDRDKEFIEEVLKSELEEVYCE